MNTRDVLGTTHAALNEAAHEWRIGLVGGVCCAPDSGGYCPMSNVRNAIR
jgi:hypothetical protein